MFISPRNITDYAAIGRPLLYSLSSQIVILLQVTISRAYFYATGQFTVKTDDDYDYFVETVTSREKGVPLITVSNHRSVADDPLIMSCILPYHLNIQPRYLRYGLCSQEYCFNPKFPSVISAYIGLGHVLPIWRGGGIDQKLLLDFARLAAQGEWCHIFPEAGVWQTETLGGRGCVPNRDNVSTKDKRGTLVTHSSGDSSSSSSSSGNNDNRNSSDASPPSSSLGKLKWGVGKLIAHAPKRPIVIPFFHSGMEKVYPHDPESNKVLHRLPRQGQDVTVRFGQPINFDDLIQEHEEQHGPLWHYSATLEEEEVEEEAGETERGMVGAVVQDFSSDRAVTYSAGTTRAPEGQEREAIVSARIEPTPASSFSSSSSSASSSPPLSSTPSPSPSPSWLAKWASRPAELRLYSKITLRIEQALRKLNEESNRELERI